MKKNKIFSGGVYAEGLRKLKIFGIISMAMMLVIEIAPVLMAYADRRVTKPGNIEVLDFWGMCPAVAVCAFVITPVMMFILFSGFNKRAFCDFYHALPYTRQCVFVSFIAAVLTWIVGMSAISMAVGITARLMLPWAYALSFSGFGINCLEMLIISLLLCGAIALASSVTGTLLSNITVSGLILFLPRYIAYVITSMVIDNVPVMTSIQSIPLLSPRYNLLIGFSVNAAFFNTTDIESWTAIIYTAVVAVAYLVLGCILFVRRKSEIAGQSAPGRKTQAIIRIALTLVPSALGTALIMSDEGAVGVILWIIAVIVYFAYEILSTMRWHNLLRAVPYFLAVVALNGIMVVTITGVSYVGLNYCPAADDVKYVRLMGAGYEYEYIANKISEYKIEDKEIIEIFCDTLAENIDTYNTYGTDYLYFTRGENIISKEIAIKDGLFTKYRYVHFNAEDYNKIISYLKNDAELKKSIMTLPDAVANSMYARGWYGSIGEITAEQGEAILEVLQKEINENSFEAWITSVGDLSYYPESAEITTDQSYITADSIYIEYTVESATKMVMGITIDKNIYPDTFNFVVNMIWENAKESAQYLEALEILESLMSGEYLYGDIDLQYFNLYCTVCSDGEYLCDTSLNVHYYDDNGKDTYDVTVNGEVDIDVAEAAQCMYELITAEGSFLADDIYVYVDLDIFDGINYDSKISGFYAPVPDNFDFDAYSDLFVYDTSYMK